MKLSLVCVTASTFLTALAAMDGTAIKDTQPLKGDTDSLVAMPPKAPSGSEQEGRRLSTDSMLETPGDVGSSASDTLQALKTPPTSPRPAPGTQTQTVIAKCTPASKPIHLLTLQSETNPAVSMTVEVDMQPERIPNFPNQHMELILTTTGGSQAQPAVSKLYSYFPPQVQALDDFSMVVLIDGLGLYPYYHTLNFMSLIHIQGSHDGQPPHMVIHTIGQPSVESRLFVQGKHITVYDPAVARFIVMTLDQAELKVPTIYYLFDCVLPGLDNKRAVIPMKLDVATRTLVVANGQREFVYQLTDKGQAATLVQ